jgi:hypothetical protein
MAGTPYSEIFDLALITLRDYKIDALYTLSPTNWATYLKGFMIRGLDNFDNCRQDLDDRNDTTNTFNITLTSLEKSIVADWMAIMWYDSELDDARQITGMIQDSKVAKRYSEANLLDSKAHRRAMKNEEVCKKMSRYVNNEIDDYLGEDALDA